MSEIVLDLLYQPDRLRVRVAGLPDRYYAPERVDVSGGCSVCGAAPGAPCVVQHCGPDGTLTPGDRRPRPHFYR